MADAENTTTPMPAPEEDGWRHYVRDAIQELRVDVRDLRNEIQSLRAEMRAGDESLRAEMHAEIAALRADMNTRFYWVIGLMVTLAGMQSALMVALLKM